ncbi:MAG: efflux RND transporter periplasmic adaptor subunit [Armatimonadetes bacterium]|nr:efflux RND transporter periplasmic adaptor subunit [Armatimonadota bacterium]
MKRIYPIFVIAFLALTGCNSGSPEAPHDDHAAEEEASVAAELKLNEDQEKIAGIVLEPAESRMMQATLDVPGNVTSTTKGRAVVTPTVAGRLIQLSVQIGDEVRQGQVLGVIESTELAQAYASISDAQRIRDAAAASVQESKAQVQIATGKLASARTVLARQKQFAAAGAFNQAPLQQAQSDLSDAQSEVLSAQKEQASHAEQVRRLENLYKEGLVSKSEIEAARLELQQDDIRLNRAKSKVDISKAIYDREKNIAQRGLANSREVQTAEAEVRSSQLERDRALTSLRSSESALANASRAIGSAQATYRTFSGGAGARGGRVNLQRMPARFKKVDS